MSSRRSCWPMKKNGKRNKHFFFSFLISISRSPPTHTKTTASIVVSLSGFFVLFCLFSSLSTDHYLKSHLFFLFLFSFVSYFNFDERVFSRFCFFFSFLRPAISAPICFHVCQRCWAIALVVVVVVVVCGSCCTRSAGLPLRQLGIASTPIKKFDRREERQSISTFSRQCPSSSDSSQANKKSVKKRKDENINKHLRAATHTHNSSPFFSCVHAPIHKRLLFF